MKPSPSLSLFNLAGVGPQWAGGRAQRAQHSVCSCCCCPSAATTNSPKEAEAETLRGSWTEGAAQASGERKPKARTGAGRKKSLLLSVSRAILAHHKTGDAVSSFTQRLVARLKAQHPDLRVDKTERALPLEKQNLDLTTSSSSSLNFYIDSSGSVLLGACLLQGIS